MEKSGLIHREGTPRSPQLYLTQAGREKAHAYHLLIDQFYMEFLASMTEEEGEMTERFLKRFSAYMHDYNERNCN